MVLNFKQIAHDICNIPDWLQANIQMPIRHDDGEIHSAVRDLLETEIGEDARLSNE